MEEYILVAKYLCTSLRISFEFLEVEFLGQWVCTKKLDFIRTAKMAFRKFLPIYIPTRNLCEVIKGHLDLQRWLSFIVRRMAFQI